MHITLVEFIALVVKYKYLILFPVFIVEGPVSTIIASYLASLPSHYLAVWPIVILAMAADLLGDFIYYSIGRWGRESRLVRKLKWLGLTPERLGKIDSHFEKHGGKTIAIGKLSHGVGWPTMIGAGVTRMPLWKFFSINTAVSLLKTGALVFIGYYYGESYQLFGQYIHYGGLIFSALAIFGVIIFFVIKNRKMAA
ncbi:MAG TPA: DedA family protein [Candidatus Paceibacterota bacterium]|nr:DedA family protein [Candidatus Paceibacterota bacterium]